MQPFIILVLVLLMCMALFVGTYIQERFANVTTVSSNKLQHWDWTRKKGWDSKQLQYSEDTWAQNAVMLKDPNVASMWVPKGNDLYVIADPYDGENNYKGMRRVATAPKGYFIALLNLKDAIQVDCSYLLLNKRVGYLDRSDYLFIQALIRGYRLPPDRIRLEQVAMKEWQNLPSLLGTTYDVIICYIIPGSPLHKLLQTQELSVMGFKNLDIDRVRMFYPYVQMENVDLKKVLQDVPGSALRVMARENDTRLPFMTMEVYWIVPSVENFITRIEEDDQESDPSFQCYGDPNIDRKALCNSKYDVIGMLKRTPTVWDQPCIQDSDCPFFKANRNYPNKRGGCKEQGMCEFPIGIKRVAYRLYDDKGVHAPFCYGCENPDDPTCCERQIQQGMSPDYAFPNDTDERKRAKMKNTRVGKL